MRYELVVIWTTGEKEVIECKDREHAEKAERNMRMAFGNQIGWTGIREKRA